MIHKVLNIISPQGVAGRLSILIFHRVLPSIDPLFPDEPDAARFDQMMGWIKSWFNVIPLDVAVAQLGSGTLPQRAAAITFDDGYADNRTVALPILQKHNLPATFFIATGFLDGGRMWNDIVIESIRAATSPILDLAPLGLGTHLNGNSGEKRQAIDAIIDRIKYLPVKERQVLTENIAQTLGVEPPNNLMMTSQQVREMRAAGMQIGAHTISHPILASIPLPLAEEEIRIGKKSLEKLLGETINLFAYPNGKPGLDYLPDHCQIVRELGFDAAVSTAWGATSNSSDIFQLPRFTPWDRSRVRYALRLLKNYYRNKEN
jgi:peptidoglycan/xylan/chitin deacetylase (PgdA/CDA1 family)